MLLVRHCARASAGNGTDGRQSAASVFDCVLYIFFGSIDTCQSTQQKPSCLYWNI